MEDLLPEFPKGLPLMLLLDLFDVAGKSRRRQHLLNSCVIALPNVRLPAVITQPLSGGGISESLGAWIEVICSV